MTKDFWSWHERKHHIHTRTATPFFDDGQVWWCWLGANIGREMDGKGTSFLRPVLILTKFNKDTFLALPLTTRLKQDRFHERVDLADGVERMAALSQCRMLDARRLRNKIGRVTKDQHVQIQKAVARLITVRPFSNQSPLAERGKRPKPVRYTK